MAISFGIYEKPGVDFELFLMVPRRGVEPLTIVWAIVYKCGRRWTKRV
jgi:hypothetical protein